LLWSLARVAVVERSDPTVEHNWGLAALDPIRIKLRKTAIREKRKLRQN